MSKGEQRRHPTVRIEPVDDDDARPTEAPPGDRPFDGDGELLAALYATPETQLAQFCREHLALASGLDEDDLRGAREVLKAVVAALRHSDGGALERLRTVVADSDGESQPSATPDRASNKGREPAEPSPWVRPWGQAYAPGSVPGAPRSAGPTSSAYGSPPSREIASPLRSDRDRGEHTQLMRYDDIDDGLTQESHTLPEGYAPPPPSEPTQPHRSSEPGPSPAPPRATEIVSDSEAPRSVRRFQGEEDSATNQLSFTSHAHAFALTVEEYAAFCAERDRTPDKARAVARRYDLFDTEVAAAVERAFELRFARDPGLRARWQRAYASFSEILRRT
jgi:hypothetical protein